MYLLKLYLHSNMFILNKNKKYNSNINGKINIGKRKGKKTLFSGGVTQSGGELVEMWDSVSLRLKKDFPKAKTCLILGVAGGSFISSISKVYPSIKITGIEIDSIMIEIYNELFKNSKIKIKLINDDAIKWIKTNNNKFDIILADLYIGRINPPSSRRNKFIENLISNLTSKGIIIFNSHYNKKDPDEFRKFKKLLDTYFYSEIIYEFPLNKVLLLNQRENISKNLKTKL